MAEWSVATLLALLALPWLSLTEASHFRGGVIMFQTVPSSSNTVRFAFRMAFRRSYSSSYYCDQSTKDSGTVLGSGDSWLAQCNTTNTGIPQCSSTAIADTGFHCTDFSLVEDWSMGENNFTYTFPNVHELWIVGYSSCCWISLSSGGGSTWLLSTVVNLTRRADTGEINSSPITTNQAIVRLQEGCPQSIRIPLEDPDGDVVRCRWSYYSESYLQRDSFPHGVLDEANCILTYQGSGSAGTYAVALTLEDFPAGTSDFASAPPLSSVGLQFLVIISSSSGPCNRKPVFTGSTPQDGQCSEIQTGSAYTATIEVTHVDHSQRIAELITSSPSGMHFSSLSRNESVYSSNVTWYPSQYQAGKQVFCFKAVDSSGIESAGRCVTILVGRSYTPNVILGSRLPINPISKRGPGLTWWSIQFTRAIKKPRTPSYIRLVLRSSGLLIYKVNTLSSHVSIGQNQTVLYFAMPFAALSMTGSYAILIDRGAIVGLGCSFDGPPTPGVSSPSQWNFNVSGICNTGFYLEPPAFINCIDVNECGAHPRSKRNWGWWPSSTITPWPMTSSSPVLSSSVSSTASCFYHLNNWRGNFSSPNHPSDYANNHNCTWLIRVTPGYYVYLYFGHFHLEHQLSCWYDSVEIFDGSSTSAPRITKRCGIQSPWCVHSSGNVLFVRFITDPTVVSSGFIAYYERVSNRSRSCSSSSPSITPTTSSPLLPHSSVSSSADVRVRLVGGSQWNEGRVEIYIKGSWGTICDDLWDLQDANVVCRMLNYRGAISAKGSAYYGAGNGSIWLDNVQCQGHESFVADCAHNGIGIHNCAHSEDAGVVCATHQQQTSNVMPTTSSASSPGHGIHPTMSSAMSSSFYVSSSINVQPPAEDFELHLPADCAQICSNTPGSFTCSCYDGFQLGSDGKTCLDIDECQTSNGGCSHLCKNIPGSFYCECANGVTMAADNKTCFEPGVTVTCHDNSMTVSLEKKTFRFMDASVLHLRYQSCRAQTNSTHIMLTTSLNGCGTMYNETQDALIFWNEVIANAVNIGNLGITRSHDIKLLFYCQYSRKKLVSLSFTPRNIVFGQERGYGNFTFKMNLYRSSSFAVPYTQRDYPISVGLNEYLYLLYSVETRNADLVVMALNCRATKDESFYSLPEYTIIQNGCERDSTLDYTYNPTSSFQRFSMKSFRFFNAYDTVYIHCEVLACHRSSANSRCARSCLSSRKRKRREAAPDEQQESTKKLWVSGGPLIIKDGGGGESGNSGQSGKQGGLMIGVVGGVGGFAIIAVVALAVLAVKYRIARLFMNRNKVGDMYTTQGENMSRTNAYVQEEDMVENDDAL